MFPVKITILEKSHMIIKIKKLTDFLISELVLALLCLNVLHFKKDTSQRDVYILSAKGTYGSAEAWLTPDISKEMSQHKMADMGCLGILKVNCDVICYITIFDRVSFCVVLYKHGLKVRASALCLLGGQCGFLCTCWQ